MPGTYKIPQNVDLEDKILGPFTLKQFLYLLAAGMATFVSFQLFYTLAPPVFFVCVFFIWVVAAAFVFVRPYDQPFTKFIFSFLWFTIKPNRRVWKRIPSLGNLELVDQPSQAAPRAGRPGVDEVRSRLQQLAHVVDTRGWASVDDDAMVTNRVTSDAEAKPRLNVYETDAEVPEDILAREDETTDSDRTSAMLDRMLKQGVAKPKLGTQANNTHAAVADPPPELEDTTDYSESRPPAMAN